MNCESKKYRRIVVKIGSNVLTREDGRPDTTRISALVDQLARLHRAGTEFILVSSGAVASGRSLLETRVGRIDTVSARQLFSAVGQVKLLNRYYDLFNEYGIACGQVLTTKESLSTRRQYLNQRNCMEAMLAAGEGIEVVIANGRRDNILTDLILTDRDVVCTRFEAAPRSASGVKKWIASSEGFAKGALHLDAGAAAAVSQSKAASILAVGVTAVEGDFERDDIVRILSPEGAPLGVGRISCDSATARRNLGRKGLKPLIHCDYLYLE